jgi:hypothetical protein
VTLVTPCTTCGALEGELCPCSRSFSRRYVVIVGGRFARMFRDGPGFAIHFDEPQLGPFRAIGTPSQVLALAEQHIRVQMGSIRRG